MKILKVNIPQHEYSIHIGRNVFESADKIISKFYAGEKIFIITDDTVKSLYADKISQILRVAGYRVFVVSCPAGEQSKSIECMMQIYSYLLNNGITRSDLIIALGGGVIGDLTGLVAATLLRGIPFVQIPTTLLAQVDSSIGGKTAINLPEGKNLVGVFNQPKSVLIDTNCLKTLKRHVFAAGMAEVIKYGAIADSDMFFDILRNHSCLNIEAIILKCCSIKKSVVEDDEKENGRRMILNFGHTFGHAIEKIGDYKKYSHGFAIAAGMVMASDFGEKLGITCKGTTKFLIDILHFNGLPTETQIDKKDILRALDTDKKRDGNSINLILLKSIGHVIIKKFGRQEIEFAL